jgi:predicted thioesterase
MTMMDIPIGLTSEKTEIVIPEKAAAHIGSGKLQVYATPAMVSLIERACQDMIDPLLPSGETSVGSLLKVRHLAPTPIGKEVKARAEVVAVEGNKVSFHVSVEDEFELVGEAEHQRVIIDERRFIKRVRMKAGIE